MTKHNYVLPEIKIRFWACQDLWGNRELEELCCGLERGYGRPCTDKLNSAYQKISESVKAGVLPCLEPEKTTTGEKFYGNTRYFYPRDAALWVKKNRSAFPDFPEALLQAVLREEPIDYCSACSLASESSSEIDIEDWASRDVWRLYDLLDLCCGHSPSRERQRDKEYHSVEDQIRRAAFIGVLHYFDDVTRTQALQHAGTDLCFKPEDAAQWVRQNHQCRFPKFPQVLLELIPEPKELPEDDQKDTAVAKSNRQASDKFSIFHNMDNLSWKEVSIEVTFDGMLLLKAKDTSKLVSPDALHLKKRLKLNNQGELLFSMMRREKIDSSNKSNVSAVSALRKILKEVFGISSDPFGAKKLGWPPVFKLINGEKKAGEQERDKELYRQSKGGKINDPGDPDRGYRDAATVWLEMYDDD